MSWPGVMSRSYGNGAIRSAIMQTRPTAPDLPEITVVSDNTLIANFDGVVPRGSKVIGQRYSSPSVVLPEGPIAGQGSGAGVKFLVSLPASHPRNAFRHKYHPDLGIGRTVNREITIVPGEDNDPSNETLQWQIKELVRGIHKKPVEARGSLTLTRVTTAGRLN